MAQQVLTRPRLAPELLDRYLLPKVALTFISAASLAGVYLTMTTHQAAAGAALARWLHLLGLGALAGGAMWWGLFFRRPAEASEVQSVARFALAQQQRFRAVGGVALLVAASTAPHLLWFLPWARESGNGGLWLANGGALLAALGGSAWLLARRPTAERAFAAGPVRLVWAALALTLVLTALLDARLTFQTAPSAWVLRPVHLLAFGLWFGGAVWNIFIAVPAAQETLDLAVVVAAARQLERFRWAVRFILPVLVLTGLLQALPYTGLQAAALAFSPLGRLILFKLGLVVGLVLIFLTCPMWRACSPIRGMCDLEDLPAPPQPTPARRLDNRGKACAGFVHISRTLAALNPDDVLELLSTDPISWWELPAWLEKHGHSLLHRERAGRLWWRSYRFLIRKG